MKKYSVGPPLLKSNVLLITCYCHCDEMRYSYILLQFKVTSNVSYYTMYKGTSLGNNITVTR